MSQQQILRDALQLAFDALCDADMTTANSYDAQLSEIRAALATADADQAPFDEYKLLLLFYNWECLNRGPKGKAAWEAIIAHVKDYAARPAPVEAVQAPEGWQMVPKVPTVKMALAFGDKLSGACGSYFEWEESGNEAYAAMLAAAAPAAPIGPTVLRGVDLAVIARSYDWTIDQHGELLGVTSGDMGYEATGIKITGDTLAIWNDGVSKIEQAGQQAGVVDGERLEFMMEREAWIAWSKDGESCRLFHRSEDGEPMPMLGWGARHWSHDPREAIDAARAASANQKGNER